jgi:hypothetical protein
MRLGALLPRRPPSYLFNEVRSRGSPFRACPGHSRDASRRPQSPLIAMATPSPDSVCLTCTVNGASSTGSRTASLQGLACSRLGLVARDSHPTSSTGPGSLGFCLSRDSPLSCTGPPRSLVRSARSASGPVSPPQAQCPREVGRSVQSLALRNEGPLSVLGSLCLKMSKSTRKLACLPLETAGPVEAHCPRPASHGLVRCRTDHRTSASTSTSDARPRGHTRQAPPRRTVRE